MTSVALAGLIAAPAGLVFVLWEALREPSAHHRRRSPRVLVSELGRRVEIEGGWKDALLLVGIGIAGADFVVSFFLGEFALGRWIWSLA